MRSQCTSMIEDFSTPWSLKIEKHMSRFEKKTWKIKVEVKRRGKDKKKEGGKKKRSKDCLVWKCKIKNVIKNERKAFRILVISVIFWKEEELAELHFIDVNWCNYIESKLRLHISLSYN